MPLEHGALVLADLSGYTRYLGTVELEHSHDVIADLLGVVAAQLDAAGLRMAKLEGDCVFTVGDVDGTAARTAIESTYHAFRARRRAIEQATSCECNACQHIGDLDLKVVAHRGEWIGHDVAGSHELTGPDVVLVHRLLKNSVGSDAYALLTEAVGAIPAGTTPHTESIDDVGDVAGIVVDLDARWRAFEAQRPPLVAPDEAALTFVTEAPAPRPLVFEALTAPEHQRRWRVALTRYDSTDPSGSRGVGTLAHCVHGKTVITHEIVDWRPPELYSYRERNPAGEMLWTVTLDELPDGTRVTMRVARRGGMLQRAAFPLLRGMVRKKLQENVDSFKQYVSSLRA